MMMLQSVRDALRIPFADPVTVGGLTMPRAEARKLERAILHEARRSRSGAQCR